MRICYVSQPAPGGANEDVVVADNDFVAVIDGATAAPGRETGCRHDVAWFARQLGAAVAGQLTVSGAPLVEALYASIELTRSAHGGDCDLSNPDSPSATVSMLRQRGAEIDYLVLADSPLLLDLDGGLRVVLDDRLDRLPEYSFEAVSRLRNSPDGFWVAGAVPEAALRAVTGSVPAASLRRAAVLSDGAARLVERFAKLSWAELLDLLDTDGPDELIDQTRVVEAYAEVRRGKRYDDATAVLVSGFGGR